MPLCQSKSTFVSLSVQMKFCSLNVQKIYLTQSRKMGKPFFFLWMNFWSLFILRLLNLLFNLMNISCKAAFRIFVSSTLAEIESLHAITGCAYRDWLYPAHRHCLSLLPWGLSTRNIGFLGIHPRFCHAKDPNTCWWHNCNLTCILGKFYQSMPYAHLHNQLSITNC